MTARAPRVSRVRRWSDVSRGLADRIHAVGWDYVSQNCEYRRQSHNATAMPKVP